MDFVEVLLGTRQTRYCSYWWEEIGLCGSMSPTATTNTRSNWYRHRKSTWQRFPKLNKEDEVWAQEWRITAGLSLTLTGRVLCDAKNKFNGGLWSIRRSAPAVKFGSIAWILPNWMTLFVIKCFGISFGRVNLVICAKETHKKREHRMIIPWKCTSNNYRSYFIIGDSE